MGHQLNRLRQVHLRQRQAVDYGIQTALPGRLDDGSARGPPGGFRSFPGLSERRREPAQRDDARDNPHSLTAAHSVPFTEGSLPSLYGLGRPRKLQL